MQEIGIEPGPELQQLHKQLLNQDPALAPAPSTREETATPPVPREERKVVTVLFCDLVESTALADRLDPEVQRRVLSRYFDTVSRLLERHGGTVEKFIGDAVMAVFGVPRLHEDDALRAVRAAAELQDALEALSSDLARDHGVALRARIGVNSGEVIVGGRPLVTGEAVNVAAHLEQAAPPGQVLVGETSFGLVREAVRAEPVELELKGKPSSVRAWRLLELVPGAAPFARRLDTPLVGRELELQQLRQGLARAVRERRAVLLTVLGPRGHRKDAARGRISHFGRSRRTSARRPLFALRRGDHVLAARRDHPGTGRRRA